MPFPYDMGRVLFGAPENTPLRVHHIVYDLARLLCEERGLHEGDEVTCLATSAGHLLIELPGHRRVLLEREVSHFVEVERLAAA